MLLCMVPGLPSGGTLHVDFRSISIAAPADKQHTHTTLRIPLPNLKCSGGARGQGVLARGRWPAVRSLRGWKLLCGREHVPLTGRRHRRLHNKASARLRTVPRGLNVSWEWIHQRRQLHR